MILGFPAPNQFEPGTTEYDSGAGRWPNIQDPGILWHVTYAVMQPNQFFRDVHAHAEGLPADQRAGYFSTIKGWLNKYIPKEEIQQKLIAAKTYAPYMVTHMYPQWGNWWAQWRIQNDLENWMRDSIHANINNLSTDADRKAHGQAVKDLLKKHGPDNWHERVPKKLSHEFQARFFAEELQEIQTAAATQIAEINQKRALAVGLGLVAVIGGVGLMNMLGRKKRK